MAQVDIGFSAEMRRNLQQIKKFAWLNLDSLRSGDRLPAIARKYEHQVVFMVAAASLPRETKLKFLENVLHQGSCPSRLAACEALASIQGDWPNRMVSEALDDADPAVQAAAAL